MPVTNGFSEPGYRYQLILRGECGPLTAWLFGDAAIESGGGCTSVIFSARDDSERYGLLDRIQDVALHLISLNQIGSSSPATRPRLVLPSPFPEPGCCRTWRRTGSVKPVLACT
jgi:hypothetical protein